MLKILDKVILFFLRTPSCSRLIWSIYIKSLKKLTNIFKIRLKSIYETVIFLIIYKYICWFFNFHEQWTAWNLIPVLLILTYLLEFLSWMNYIYSLMQIKKHNLQNILVKVALSTCQTRPGTIAHTQRQQWSVTVLFK